MRTIILHDWKSGDEIEVIENDYSHEGSLGDGGTNIWWRDLTGERHSAFVRESPEEIQNLFDLKIS